MPIYEYQCSACGEELEVIQKMNDPVKKKCPKCKKLKLEKLISAAGFRLTGTGWYETDFKDSGKKKEKPKEKAKEKPVKEKKKSKDNSKASSSS